MKRFLYFINTYSPLLTFLMLEGIALQSVFNKKLDAKTNLFDPVNPIISYIYQWRHGFGYQGDTILLEENASLRQALLKNNNTASLTADSAIIPPHFKIIPAHVINNSVIFSTNYLTLNRGIESGIKPGMGVFSPSGVVGIVKYVSKHFSTVVSLLHTAIFISAKMSNSEAVGTLHWPGKNPSKAELLYIPTHIAVSVGDTLLTSGYGTAFYAGIPLGVIEQVRPPTSNFFYEIVVGLQTDFSSLHYVYVIDNSLSQEQDSLENLTKVYYE